MSLSGSFTCNVLTVCLGQAVVGLQDPCLATFAEERRGLS